MARQTTDPDEWIDGSLRADEVRETLVDQLGTILRERRMTGGQEAFSTRLRQVAEARDSGDPLVLRAAVMELTIASAQWVTAIDLEAHSRVG